MHSTSCFTPQSTVPNADPALCRPAARPPLPFGTHAQPLIDVGPGNEVAFLAEGGSVAVEPRKTSVHM